jgi:hypothetical protein
MSGSTEDAAMGPEEAQETAERDQLWASLRALRPQIDRLAAGEFEDDEPHRQMVVLLARIIATEMDYRARNSQLSEPPAEEV